MLTIMIIPTKPIMLILRIINRMRQLLVLLNLYTPLICPIR